MLTRHRASAGAAERLAIPAPRPRSVYSTRAMARPLALLLGSQHHPATARGRAARRCNGACCLVGLLGACAPEPGFPLPPVVWEGESVRVRMDDPGIEVCGGSFEALDRHATLVRQALLLEGDGLVEYSIGDEDFVDAACNLDAAAGCSSPTTGHVFTTIPMHEHELVHAVRILDPKLSLHGSPLEEGLATVFGGDRFDDDAPPLEPSIFLAKDQLMGALEYYHAGQMVALLLARYGTDAFRRFDTRASTMDEDGAFLATFDESKEQFVAANEMAPYCEQSQWWAPLLECDGEPAAADPMTGELVLSGSLDCSEADVYGPRAERMWASQHFRIDERTSTLAYHFDMPEDATLEVVACSGNCPERFAYLGTRDQVGSVRNGLPALEPGDYFLRVSRPLADDDGYFEVVLH